MPLLIALAELAADPGDDASTGRLIEVRAIGAIFTFPTESRIRDFMSGRNG
jgi:hypothetical protein